MAEPRTRVVTVLRFEWNGMTLARHGGALIVALREHLERLERGTLRDHAADGCMPPPPTPSQTTTSLPR